MKEYSELELSGYEGEDRVIGAIEHDLRLRKEGKGMVRMVRSLLPGLDRATDGFYPGEVITVSGFTKNGKTLFCQSLTANFATQQVYPLWFSYEVPAVQFYSQFPTLPNFYVPMRLKAHSMDWVETRIKESLVKFKTTVVFIDHLHFLFDMARSKQVSLEIGQVIRRLKGIAIEYGLVIFLLCHTIKAKPDAPPDYSNIRDSGLIAQESDSVFMVHRTPKIGENAAQVRVEFHRRTGVMEKIIHLIKIDGLLREVATDEILRPKRKLAGNYSDGKLSN